MFDPKVLKTIALTKQAANKKALKKEPSEPEPIFTEKDLSSYQEELEKHITSFAEEGYLSVDYQFNDEHTLPLIRAFAQYFKQKHPLLMIIISEGQKRITVTWDGNNHV